MTYEFQEYPKWVKTPDGRELIVQNQDEELAFLQAEKQKDQNEVADAPKRRGRPPKNT